MSDDLSSQEPLVQLVYASAATVAFDDAKLESLLERARRHNAAIDVTGVLLFQDATFFQVLEGRRRQVETLYDAISRDPRHNNVLLLVKREVEQRNFGCWSMGFVPQESDLENLQGFVDFLRGRGVIDLAGDSQSIRQTLEGFRRGRWRRQPDPGSTTTALDPCPTSIPSTSISN